MPFYFKHNSFTRWNYKTVSGDTHGGSGAVKVTKDGETLTVELV